ncbi:MAG: nucleotide exchange factor GrpE [Candidatus Competibacteraceae bacterium]
MIDKDILLNVWLQEATRQPIEAVEMREYQRVLLDFLDVLDSLDRLVTLAEPTAPRADDPTITWIEHLRTLRNQLLESLRRAGVDFFECIGQRFDPSRHEAVETIQRYDVDDYTVVEQLIRGCEWRGHVLRFARVVVARRSD